MTGGGAMRCIALPPAMFVCPFRAKGSGATRGVYAISRDGNPGSCACEMGISHERLHGSIEKPVETGFGKSEE